MNYRCWRNLSSKCVSASVCSAIVVLALIKLNFHRYVYYKVNACFLSYV